MTAQLRDSASRYGAVSIALHWGAAIGVLALLGLAIGVWLAPTEAIAEARLRLHASVGVLFYPLIVARILWRAFERGPASIVASAFEARVAAFVHPLLLVLLASQLITGPLDIWSGGWAIAVIDGVEIPAPFPRWSQAAHDLIGQVHRWTGVAILALVALHIAATTKHYLANRDGVAERMLGLPRADRRH